MILSCIISSIWLSKYLDEKTRYNKDDYMNTKLYWFFILFSPICLFNIKRLKHYRENKYKNKIIKEMLIYRPDCDELKILLREQKLKKIKK